MTLKKTTLTAVERNAKRASYDLTKIKSVIDEAIIGHLAFTLDNITHSIPLLFWHYNDYLYCHAAINGRLSKLANSNAPVCVSFVIQDGFVLAKSALHHSMNYRSAVVYGSLDSVSSHEEMTSSFHALMNLIDQQRWVTVRPPNTKELKACAMLKLPLNEAVMKQRTGFAKDKKSDIDIEAWTGVIPIEQRLKPPQPDPYCSNVISEKLAQLSKNTQ